MKAHIISATYLKTLASSFGILLLSNTSAQEIAINQRSHIVLNGNVSLVINNASLKNNGSFSAGTGTVKFTGYSDTTSSFLEGGNNTTFYNLTIDKAAYGVA